MKKINKPNPSEYAPFYAGYVAQVGEEDVVLFLEQQEKEVRTVLGEIREEDASLTYAKGKWTIAQLLEHINDVERVMAYRILRLARNDRTELAGFDQDLYVTNGAANKRSIASFSKEFSFLRLANLELIYTISEEQSRIEGKASDVIFSVRALMYILAGHVSHHMIIMKDRYLSDSV